MSQSRPPIAPSTGSSGLLPFASLRSPDSYFKELKKVSSRQRVCERSSDNLRQHSPTPKRSRSPKARSSSPVISNYSIESLSRPSSAANNVEPSEYSPLDSQSFANEIVATSAVGDPPRPPKLGYEWVWFPDPYCYWAERPEIPRNTSGISKAWTKWKRISFTGRASTSSIEKLQSNIERKQSIAERRQSNAAHRQSIAERGDSTKMIKQDANINRCSEDSIDDAPASPTQSSLQNKLIKGFQFLSPKMNSPLGDGEGFFKSKAGKGKRVYQENPSSSGSDHSVLSRTATVLKGVAEVLEHHERQHSDSIKPLIDSHFSNYRKGGLFTRHKRNSQESLMSITDSIRSILRGRTPVVTPVPEPKYTGSNGKKYLKVDLGAKDGLTYLPSEATRINTPPLPNETPGAPTRGFFFELSPPSHDYITVLSESLTSAKPMVSPPQCRKLGLNSRSPTGRTAPESPCTPGSRNKIARLRLMWENGFQQSEALELKKETKSSIFELDVPEHFPSSPLCPMNPKHKSGGTGICVYHGRRKESDASIVLCK